MEDDDGGGRHAFRGKILYKTFSSVWINIHWSLEERKYSVPGMLMGLIHG